MRATNFRTRSLKKRNRTPALEQGLAFEPLEVRQLLSTVVWTSGVNLPAARGGAAALVEGGGAILVAGGGNSSVSVLPYGGSAWTAATDSGYPITAPAIGNTSAVGIVIYGGSAGGAASNQAITYNPTNADLTDQTTSMSSPRKLMAYATDQTTWLYAIGGLNGSNTRLASVERYYSINATWSTMAPLPVALSGAAAVDDGAGHILVFGGATNSAAATTSVYRYTISTNTWDTLAPMPTATTEAGAVLGSDGEIYVIGGLDATGAAQATVQQYDLTSNTWTPNTWLPAAVSDEAVVSDAFGRIEVIGGNDASHQPVATVTVSQYLNQPEAAPSITSAAVTQVPASGVYTYQVTATANPQPVYSLTTAPTGMTIDPASGFITWTPTPAQMTTTQNVIVAATNRDGQATQSFAIAFAAPVITTTTLGKASANAAYGIQIASTGNPTPTYVLTAAPTGMTITTAGLISWTPTTAQVGNQTVTLQATNTAGQTSQTYTLPVAGLAPTGLVAAGASTTSIALSWNPVSDPDGATYNVYEQHFIHSPRGSGGSYTYSLIASNVSTTSITIGGFAPATLGSSHTYVVTSVNNATHLESAHSNASTGTTWYAPDVYVFTINGADWSGPVAATVGTPIPKVQFAWYANPSPVFTVVSGPSGLSIDPNTSVITYTPAPADVGTVTAVFQATNPAGSMQMSITFDVAPDLQVPPVITWPTLAPFNPGTPFTAAQMNAVATDATTGAVVPGTFTYTAIVPNSTTSITLIDPTWLGAGTWPITATFVPSDPIHYTNASVTQDLVVYQATSTTTLTESSNTSVAGEPVTFTATAISSGGFYPTGTIDFMDGTTDLGSVYMDVNGSASLTTNALAVGGHTITAVYSGDSNTIGSSSDPVTQSVSQANSAAALATSLGATVSGQAVTFTTTVSPVDPSVGTPTGTVTYVDGANVLGAVALDATGTAVFSTSSLSVGTHTITAIYGGDANYAGSLAPSITQTVGMDATTTALAASPTSSVAGQAVTLTASISAQAPGSGTPTGAVTFKDGTTTLGTGALSNGVATLTTSTLSVATHSLTVSYAGNGNFNASTSTAVSLVVKKATATAAVTAAPSPSVYGQSVTFTATVAAAAPGSGTPTGTVTFKDGTTTLATATLSGGTARFTTSTLSVATHNVTISYAGDANFNTAISAAFSHVVNKASVTATVTSTPNPSVFGQSVTLTATVKVVAPGTGTPTGTVTFYDGSTSLGTGTLSSGTATLKTTKLAVGTHNITITYAGSTNYASATSAVLSQVVNKAASTVTLTSSANPATHGTSITLTATVKVTSPGAATPTGTITFYDGTTVLGTVTVGTGGVAKLTTSTLAVGSHSITAVYSGDIDLLTSTSVALLQKIN
jgi:hypothetical protein